jgi:pimeloyl-ACP methyl ester carboxylesterase
MLRSNFAPSFQFNSIFLCLAAAYLLPTCLPWQTTKVCWSQDPASSDSEVVKPASSSETQNSTDPEKKIEKWVGWIESPQQQLRTVISLERDQNSQLTKGTLVSPDQSPDPLMLHDLQLSQDGKFQFELRNPQSGKVIANYMGLQLSPDQISGEFSQASRILPLNLKRVDELPAEAPNSLGADSTWTGTLNVVVQKLDFRFRIYSKPPFATADEPRVLFDSLSEKAIGIPATVKMDADRNVVFEIGLIAAKYAARLNESADELDGSYTQGPLPIPLKMVLLKGANAESNTVTKSQDKVGDNKKMRPSDMPQEPDAAKEPEPAKIVDFDLFTEQEFSVTHSIPKQRGKEQSENGGVTLVGTLTIPKNKAGTTNSTFPAVVMVTGSGPQDRNETIGKHKPFEVLAHSLAKMGIASLRYDDRGVGQSKGDFLNATTEDFTKDAIAVWKYARALQQLNPKTIGILGHSEGGIVGPMAANWEPEIAFLILLAPPGVSGSEILKSQIDRMAELEGMSVADRKATMQLQDELQSIASGYVVDEASLQRDIRMAINKNWEALKSIALAQDPSTDTEQLRVELTTQIEQQFQQLRTPWYQYFLNYDPATDWMLLRCPTLAIWGDKDVQVLPDLNRGKIEESVRRNVQLDTTLTILPGLNHLFQTAETGMPDEYDAIEETISPTLLESIRVWVLQQGIISR